MCSVHFVSGKKSNDHLSPDFVLTIFKHVSSPLKRQKMSDFNAYNRRKLAYQARVENAIKQQAREEQTRKEKAAKAEAGSERAAMEDTARDEAVVSMVESSRGSSQSVATQTELSVLDIEYMETRACEVRVRESVLTREFLGSGSSKVPDLIKFYTGLPSYPRLMAVYDYVSSSLVKNASSALPLFQQFLITLMKLRLNISDQVIAYRFGISQSAVSKNFRKWVNIMYIYLKPFIVWPGREEVMKLCLKYLRGNSRDAYALSIASKFFVSVLVT